MRFIYEDNARFDGNVLHVECFWSSSFFGTLAQFFLLSVVVATIGIAVASVSEVAKPVVSVVGISRGFGFGGSFSRPLAVDKSTSDIGVANVAKMGTEAVDTVVRVSLGSGSSISRPLAIVVAITGIDVRVASIAVVSEPVVAVVGIGGRGSLGVSGPLAIVVAIAITSIESTIAEAIVAIVRVSLRFGLRSGHDQGGH